MNGSKRSDRMTLASVWRAHLARHSFHLFQTSRSCFSAWSYKTGKRIQDIFDVAFRKGKNSHERTATPSKKKPKVEKVHSALWALVNLTSPKVVSVKTK